MIDVQIMIAILALAGTVIAAQSALIVAILRRNNHKSNSKKSNPSNPNHIMEHLKSLHKQADDSKREMLSSMSATRAVVREGNTIMVSIKALLEAHVRLHNRGN